MELINFETTHEIARFAWTDGASVLQLPSWLKDASCQTAQSTINKSLIQELLGTFLLVQHFLTKLSSYDD